MVGIYPFDNYRILFTPLVGTNRYGAVVDVTQDVDITDFVKNLGSIKKELDNGDYDIGIFTFGDITLNMINHNRKFNSPDDPRSMFKFTRDRCKVDIIFYLADGSSTNRFRGLINDDATRLDFTSGIIKFKVLSLDSIFRQVEVGAGVIVDGDSFSTAIKKILNVPAITNTLTYSAGNINVDYDGTIDVGEEFSSIPVKGALDDLLLASNSVLYVDNSDVLHVKARTESATQFNLYGHGDIYGRENILKIHDFNNGLQRTFSSISVNATTISTDDNWVVEYGFRKKELTFDFITTTATEQAIADNILSAFKIPKLELKIEVSNDAVSNIELLDIVKVDYPYRHSIPPETGVMPMYGVAQYGVDYYAPTTGTFEIKPDIKWKVISIQENPVKFTTTLKLRQVGTTTSDGYF